MCIGVAAAAAPEGVDSAMSRIDDIVNKSGGAADAAAAEAAAQAEIPLYQERLTSEMTLKALHADAYLLVWSTVTLCVCF